MSTPDQALNTAAALALITDLYQQLTHVQRELRAERAARIEEQHAFAVALAELAPSGSPRPAHEE